LEEVLNSDAKVMGVVIKVMQGLAGGKDTFSWQTIFVIFNHPSLGVMLFNGSS